MNNYIHSIEYFEPRFIQRRSNKSLFFNTMTFLIILMIFSLFVWGTGAITGPVTVLDNNPVTLDYINLFKYSGRTVLRMFCAIILSLIFTLTYASLAAKNKYCEQILIPLLDILQSVPILGYISFTITAFLGLFPGSIIGFELASIFAIFTSQAWNMAFSFYESLKTIPEDLKEVAFTFNMTKWQKFWRLEVPYAIPPLVWNMVLSVSGGWLFVVASEVITVGNNHITLPGIGSYISLALLQKNLPAIIYGIVAIGLVIFIYDQLLIRPLIVWSERFRCETTTSQTSQKSLILSIFYRSNIAALLALIFSSIARFIIYLPILNTKLQNDCYKKNKPTVKSKEFRYLWYIFIIILGLFSAYKLFEYFYQFLSITEVIHVFKLTSTTLLRVLVLLTVASIIWVPIGIFIGLNPKYTAIFQPIIQFLASFPVNLLFPIAAMLITKYKLNPNIWLSILMITGAQWYILFNVIAGAMLYPNDLKEVIKNLNVKGWLWFKKAMLPAITPWLSIGVITAFGGAWNISIVSEVITYGNTTISASGIGSYIANSTVQGDFPKIILGIFMMSLFVVAINRLIWRPLLRFVNAKYSIR